jgi:hypothetical protein
MLPFHMFATPHLLSATSPPTICVLNEHRESASPSRSHRKDPDSSLRPVLLFSRRSTPLGPFISAYARHLSKDRANAGAHTCKQEWADSAQFWCNVSPLDATLLSLLVCVANKELTQYLSLLDATLTKNIGGGGSLQSLPPYLVTSLPRYFSSSSPEAPFPA